MTLRYDRECDTIMICSGGGQELRDDILELVKREIAAEREACAALCDPFPGESISLDSCIEKKVRTELAAKIRSRV